MEKHLGVPYSEYHIDSGQRWLICGTEPRYSKLVPSCDECPIRFKCWTSSEDEEIPLTNKERALFEPKFNENSINSRYT